MKLEPLQLPDLPPGDRYLIGVSGGRDSVALLHALTEAGFARLIVCHLNHGLRGRASADDARFVERLAGALHLDFETEKVDVQQLASATGESIETAARSARLAFFGRVVRRRRCHSLFLAHHAGDQAETLLFNLFRGAGPSGLTAMSADSVRMESASGEGTGRLAPVRLRVLRPMLAISREQIDAYIAERGLRFREDASNASLEHTRNRIRHELLPLANRIFGRDVRPVLNRTAEILRAEEEWLGVLTGTESPERLSVPALKAAPVALQRRRILGWLRARLIPNCGFEEVEAVRSLLEGTRAKVNLPGNWHARRRAKQLFLEPGRDLGEAAL